MKSSPADELRRLERGAAKKRLTRTFEEQMQAATIPPEWLTHEHEFARSLVSERYPKGRAWRFDYAVLPLKIGVEVDGGAFSGGRHTTGSGFTGDCQKLNAAALLGWTVLRGTAPMVRDHSLVDSLVQLLKDRLAARETPPAT